MGRVYAAADIGSNTAHLLVAEESRGQLRRLANESDWLSLGEIVSREGKIPKPQVDRLVSTLKRFKQTASSLGASGLYVFATEAMRKAANCDEIVARLKRETGIALDIIPPAREAELSLKGVLPLLQDDGPFILLETGGGSVQVAEWDGKAMSRETSLPIGTGTLIAQAELTQPSDPDQVKQAVEVIRSSLESVSPPPPSTRVVACGGVARGIWRALHPEGDPYLHCRELEYLAWDSQRLNIAQIIGRYGVKHRRALTLLPGCLVYLEILRWIGQESMYVSEYGVREGAIFEMKAGKGNRKSK